MRVTFKILKKDQYQRKAYYAFFKTSFIVVRDRSIFNKSLIDGRTVYEADELKGHEGSVEDIDRLCNELIEIYSRGV